MISAMWHPGKGKTMETKKLSCFQVLGRGRGEQAEHRERLGQGNSSVGRCKSRYTSLEVLQSLSRVWLLWPPDCSLPGSSVHGDSLGKKTGVGRHFLLQGIFPTQDSNLGPLHCRQILYQLSYEGSPKCTRHYMLVKIYRRYNMTLGDNGESLQVLCCNKHTPPVWDVHGGRLYVCGGRGIGDSLYFSQDSAVNPEHLLKLKFIN